MSLYSNDISQYCFVRECYGHCGGTRMEKLKIRSYVIGRTFLSTFRVVRGWARSAALFPRKWQLPTNRQLAGSGLLHDSSNSVLWAHELLRRPRSRLRFASSLKSQTLRRLSVSCLTTTARLAPNRPTAKVLSSSTYIHDLPPTERPHDLMTCLR